MAGDWIPMRTNLEDDPTVIFMARMTKLQPDHVVGKLHRFWSWADSHTADGSIQGIDADWIDGYVKKRGFAVAMSTAPQPWLEILDSGVTIPHFTNWFGSSGKSRLMATRRQQVSRSKRDNCHGESVTKTLLQNSTEEKRLITSYVGDDEWGEIRTKAKAIADKIGTATTDRNKRLLLGACVLAREIGQGWLDNAVRNTREATPDKPYAYLRTVLTATAGDVDFRASLDAIEFPVKRAISIPEVSTC